MRRWMSVRIRIVVGTNGESAVADASACCAEIFSVVAQASKNLASPSLVKFQVKDLYWTGFTGSF